MNGLPDYYTTLFNSVTDAIAALQALKCDQALRILVQAQQQAEEQYMTQHGHEQ